MVTAKNNRMKIYREVFSPIDVNTYIVTGDDSTCIIIDCGCYGKKEEEVLADLLLSLKLKPVLLLDTHCHLDHIFGNNFMLERYGLKARYHEGDKYNLKHAPDHARMFGLTMEEPPEAGENLTDDEIISAAGLIIEVIAVPGHSPGGVAFWCKEGGAVFTGDALFAGSVGRSDLYGGDHNTLMVSITERLFSLPSDTVVYPGHGPETTIRHEMETNPFFN